MENTILNYSRVEEDPFALVPQDAQNITGSPNEYYQKWQPTTMELILNYTFFALELAKFFLAIGAILADILLIYLILRYKRIRKNLNLYIVHYAVFNLAYYVIAPLFFIVHAFFLSGYSYLIHIFCYLGMLEVTSLFLTLILALLMAIDWTVSCFKPKLIEKIRTIYTNKFKIIYVFYGALAVINCVGCISRNEYGHFILLYSMPLMFIILLAMHYIRRQKILDPEHLKTEYSLWICTIVVGCYIPVFLIHILSTFLDEVSFGTIVMIYYLAEYFFSFLCTPTPIFVLYYLMKWNKHVRMAFDTTFRKTVRTYGADNLDDASDNEEIVENGTQKNVQTNSNGSEVNIVIST